MSGFPNPNSFHHNLPSPTSPPAYGSPPPAYGNHGSTPLAHPPPTPSAPFLGPIELPYSPTPPASARQLPYAPLLVSLGSPTSSIGSSGSGSRHSHSHSHSSSISSVGSVASAGSGSGHSHHGSVHSATASVLASSASASGSSSRPDYSRRTSSSRQRDVAPQPIPPLNTSTGANAHGLATPPTSPTHSLNPLLRTSANGFASLIYSVLSPPAFSGPSALFHPSHPTLSMNDLFQPATDPPVTRISAIIQYSAHPQSRSAQFPWAVSIRPSRQGTVISVYDVLYGLYQSLNTPVGEQEMSAFSTQWVDAAKVEMAKRMKAGSNVSGFVRSDFLQSCVYFAGMVVGGGQNGQMVIKLLPRLH